MPPTVPPVTPPPVVPPPVLDDRAEDDLHDGHATHCELGHVTFVTSDPQTQENGWPDLHTDCPSGHVRTDDPLEFLADDAAEEDAPSHWP